MTHVFSDEELDADDRVRNLYEPINRRSWAFTRRDIALVEPMEPIDFLNLFRSRLNITRQASWAHFNVSFHTIKKFDWHLDVMVHHGVHVGITSDALAYSHLVLALRKYEEFADSHGAYWTSLRESWDMVRSVARRIKLRLLKMARKNSLALADE